VGNCMKHPILIPQRDYRTSRPESGVRYRNGSCDCKPEKEKLEGLAGGVESRLAGAVESNNARGARHSAGDFTADKQSKQLHCLLRRSRDRRGAQLLETLCT